MNTLLKEHYFEFVLYHLIQWYREACPYDSTLTNLTRLKVLKLLFFVSIIKNQESDLLDIFDKFYAMQYGPVEGDIYNALTKDKFEFYTFKDSIYVKEKCEKFNQKDLSLDNCERILQSITLLKQSNPSIIKYTPVELVTLSHLSACWRNTFNLANMIGKGSLLMDVDNLRKESHLFSL